jgi:hypothetical protein
MKPKNLRKKIRRLEARLKKDAKKLAKLKRKGRLTRKTQVKPATVKGQSAAKKQKRKLNLTPERRAQLAAAMKARWAAKRAAAAANAQKASTDQDFALRDIPQPQ